MKVVILAGGLGTRLRPVTYEIPKPLITVKKKPIINHLIDFFHKSKVSDIGLLISREHEADFKRWHHSWKDEMPSEKIKIFFEEKPLGTFGGLGMLKEWLGNETFVLSNGDELKDFNFELLKNFHAGHEGIATIALVRVSNPHEYGVPILDGDRIMEFLEKPQNPPSDFISSGMYFLDPEVLDYADFKKEFIMIERDIFPKLAKEGKLFGLKMEGGRWFDCGTLERWEKAMKEW